MSDKDFERILKSIDKNVLPPQGLKEKMLSQILNTDNLVNTPVISTIEKLIFEKPLRAACAFSSIISLALWAIMGSGYTGILTNLLGIR